jgi:hypothetical protein
LNPEDGESMFLWNMNANLQHMSKHRRPKSEKSLLWHPPNLRSRFYRVLKLSGKYQVSLPLIYIITCKVANSLSYPNLIYVSFCSPEARLQMQFKYQCSILHFCTMYVLNTDHIPNVIINSDRSTLTSLFQTQFTNTCIMFQLACYILDGREHPEKECYLRNIREKWC